MIDFYLTFEQLKNISILFLIGIGLTIIYFSIKK